MWQENENFLYQKFEFKDFKTALNFINQVGEIANELDHHPKITNNYNIVELWLSTHSAGDKVSEKDLQLVKLIGEIKPIKEVKRLQVDVFKPTIIKELKTNTDGGSRGNPGPSATGYVILNMENKVIERGGDYLGITTNNQAEYQAVFKALSRAKHYGALKVSMYMDSLLVVNQMIGIFKIRNRELWPVHDSIKQLAKEFKTVTFHHVPREQNKLADAEVNKILDDHAGNKIV